MLDKTKPWRKHLYAARYRCNNVRGTHYPCYGGKGIRVLLTEEQIHQVWLRDKAYRLKIPSLDRIESNKNYELNNVRFIEKKANIREGRSIVRISNNGEKEVFRSLRHAANSIGVTHTKNICHAARGKRPSAHGFTWRYTNETT